MASPRTNIYLTNSCGETVIDDFIERGCHNCIIEAYQKELKTVDCPLDGIRRRVLYSKDENGSLCLCDDKEKTTKNFMTMVELVKHCRPSLIGRHNTLKDNIRRETRKEIDAFKHNIVHLNSDAINEFYSFIEQEYLVNNYRKLQEKIEETIKKNPQEAVELIARLARYNLNMKTEISVISKLNNPDSKPNFGLGNPRDAVMSSVYTLYPLFKKRSVFVNVGEYWEKFDIDYDALQVASFYIIENATKYSEKGSTVNIAFKRDQKSLRIEFSMRSFFIDEIEEPHLFEEGYQGELAKKSGREGKGIGLYRAKRLIEFFGGSISLDAGIAPITGKDGKYYADNQFFIDLPIRVPIK